MKFNLNFPFVSAALRNSYFKDFKYFSELIGEVSELGGFIGERRMVVEAKEGKLRKRVILHKSKF